MLPAKEKSVRFADALLFADLFKFSDVFRRNRAVDAFKLLNAPADQVNNLSFSASGLGSSNVKKLVVSLFINFKTDIFLSRICQIRTPPK